MLGILPALVFVKAAKNLPDQVAGWVVVELLGDGYQRDARLAQPVNVHLAQVLFAEEPRHGVHKDRVERPFGRRGRVDHALELGAAVIGRGRARLGEGFDQLQTAGGAVVLPLLDLVRDRQLRIGLPRGGNPDVESYSTGVLVDGGHGAFAGSRICAILSLRKARTSRISASVTGSFGPMSEITRRAPAGPRARGERCLTSSVRAAERSMPPESRHDLAHARVVARSPVARRKSP